MNDETKLINNLIQNMINYRRWKTFKYLFYAAKI